VIVTFTTLTRAKNKTKATRVKHIILKELNIHLIHQKLEANRSILKEEILMGNDK